ncbi:DUF6279 family lipoprotein [Microbulbifer thermotolerans]|uniref:DUF6279 family lipoprotein n=1 Tax=Microbulbifer thermotolerans TaxID=252514 RepID=UPI002248E655|nr:DUF6279 family lipoprotein [Microbulbifer thermotolerans]MCX2780542.1 DUF6279 family lipoprotein [Microbulbifer thermotolerans]MCX2803528.1 DUF6279 family lipoprotein [Microbulbifer thermotolerans]MCX2829998.1 DUF6279 family lipoprotein [Microbulbifer thermotolerans]MCX2841467.1 DUF6279 family lipoprotein [Microbulbifer thermotolerans]
MARPAAAILKRTRNFATLISTLLLLASCSSVQFAYNHLDLWMRWQLDDYVDFNAEQKAALHTALDSFHTWHRQTQLPRYADYLELLAERVEQNQLRKPHLESTEIQIQKFLHTASAQLCDLLLPLAETLTPAQIDTLEKTLRKKREESLEKWQKTPDKIQRRRNKHIRKQSKRWLGSLSLEQEQMIAAWVTQVEYNPLERNHQREIWQARFVELLRNKPEGYQAQLRNLVLYPEQLWSKDYRRIQEERQRQARRLGERILASTTEAQRAHLIRTLRKYAQDFRTLSAN